MNLNTLMQVRHQTWQSFARAADALFELADALTCESAARSLPELSLSPRFRRQWPSIYAALEDGNHLQFRQARACEVSVSRVVRERAKESRRDPRESWLCWLGPVALPLCEVVSTYRYRFSHEHTYRFLKQDLFWTKARLRRPEQFERWSLIVATAMNQLVLARSLGQASFRPWERRQEVVAPRHVRLNRAENRQDGQKEPAWRKRSALR